MIRANTTPLRLSKPTRQTRQGVTRALPPLTRHVRGTQRGTYVARNAAAAPQPRLTRHVRGSQRARSATTALDAARTWHAARPQHHVAAPRAQPSTRRALPRRTTPPVPLHTCPTRTPPRTLIAKQPRARKLPQQPRPRPGRPRLVPRRAQNPPRRAALLAVSYALSLDCNRYPTQLPRPALTAPTPRTHFCKSTGTKFKMVKYKRDGFTCVCGQEP